MKKILALDGRTGGGALLRSALALSASLGVPFRVQRFRAGEQKPGLLREHLAAIRAFSSLCGGKAEGAVMGSEEFLFEPGEIHPKSLRVALGVAGSAAELLQSLVLPLARGTSGTSVALSVTGATYSPGSVPGEFLTLTLGPALQKAGWPVAFEQVRRGFPAPGAGEVRALVSGNFSPEPLELVRRGEIVSVRARVVLKGLAPGIADREARVVSELLGPSFGVEEASVIRDRAAGSEGVGNAVVIEAATETGTAVFSSAGSVRTSAESVAEAAAREALRFLNGMVPVTPELAERLLVPLALGAGGVFRTTRPTARARATAEAVRLFTGNAVGMEKDADGAWTVRVKGVRKGPEEEKTTNWKE